MHASAKSAAERVTMMQMRACGTMAPEVSAECAVVCCGSVRQALCARREALLLRLRGC